jgi:hypothetical protein
MADTKGSFEFRGKASFAAVAGLIIALGTGGIKVYSLADKVENLNREVRELRANSDVLKDRIPRIEVNLEYIKNLLEEVRRGGQR